MYIIMVASECAPVAKVGGLADVVFGLSQELEIRGNAVEIILPKYDCMHYEHIWGLHQVIPDLWVPWYGGAIHCSVWFGFVHGRKCFFIDPHSQDSFFNRGHCYGSWDDPMRFAFFSKAAMEFMLKSGKRPDIIHCHDWQTALVPVLLFEMYQSLGMDAQRVCYTIHNFNHQGVAGESLLAATGLRRPEYFFHIDRLQHDFNPHVINMMKGGIVYSNFVTTVSPQHAYEARYTDQNRGLGHTLYIHQNKFTGVLNGLDYTVWNPEIDPLLSQCYTAVNVEPKYVNQQTLRERFWLRQDAKPLVAYVGRLDPQKGVDLIRHGLFFSICNDAQFVLLGTSPDPHIHSYFQHLKHHLNDHPDCHLELSFSEELAHLIYAGADMLIVPSLFEPCGLAQMIALKYGTVPIVRAVGGLMDTVFDWDDASHPLPQRNGYVFHQAEPAGLESALRRAFALWREQPEQFRQLLRNGMGYDYSWRKPGQEYLGIYNRIRHK